MIALKIYKSKTFFFYIPLEMLIDQASISDLEKEKLTYKIYSINKLDHKTKESETLSLIYETIAQDNRFTLFNDLVAIGFCKIKEENN